MSLARYTIWTVSLLLLATLTSRAQSQPPRGLTGTYYSGQNFERSVAKRVDDYLDFEWRKLPPAPGVPAEHFSARWTGFLEAPVTGEYVLLLTSDDGVRLWLGKRLLVDSWRDQYFTTKQARVQLEAGKFYALRVEYYQNTLESRLQLAWQRPDASMTDFFGGQPISQPIPMRYLWTAQPANSATALTVRRAATRITPVKSALVIGYRLASPEALSKPALPVAVPRATWPAPRPRPTPAPTPQPRPAPPDMVLPDLASLSRGVALTLPNLYFTQSTAALLPTSRPTLNALARRLREQPALRLEIAGHTDNIGDAQLNLRLSEQRARVVRQYLVQQGIDSVRLAARGYGGTRPIADNRDLQLRPRNRRVEVVVQ